MNLQSQLHTYKESFLHSAARTGRLSECASLLSMDPNLDWCPSTAGSTPSSSGVLRTESNDTALLAAARGGHKDVVALLLAHGASVNRRTAAGETILHLAVNSGAVELVSLVVEAMEGKEDVLKCKDKEGKTALALATVSVAAAAAAAVDLKQKRHLKTEKTNQQTDRNRRNKMEA